MSTETKTYHVENKADLTTAATEKRSGCRLDVRHGIEVCCDEKSRNQSVHIKRALPTFNWSRWVGGLNRFGVTVMT